jgi:hypothetical protein
MKPQVKFDSVQEMAKYWYSTTKYDGSWPFPENALNIAMSEYTTANSADCCPTCLARVAGKIADDLGYMNEGWSLGV